MGEFAKVIQPHLEAHGIEGPVELARRIREAGRFRGAPEVRRWMDGDPGSAGYGDLVAIQRAFGLDDEETDSVEEAFYRDLRAEERVEGA
jgi:hypothetical protein